MRLLVAALAIIFHRMIPMNSFRCSRGLGRHILQSAKMHADTRNPLDTIYALSSGQLTKTGVAVVRLSGPNSRECLEKLTPGASFPVARRAVLRRLSCPKTSDMIDQALVLWFPAPKSFTGEDVVEFHVHGSRAVIQGLFSVFEDIDNTVAAGSVRPAERGEFTRRAFDNGKMDLTEVEGLADLLAADTSEQRKQALRQMDGYLRIQFEKWREDLIGCLAHTEAVIDFGDDDREDDINDSAMWALLPRVQKLKDELSVHLRDGRRGEMVREGVKIALAGPPNAGKSSLLNALAKRPAAIVSPIAGTTRDVVEVRLDLNGVQCIISDTAGLRLDSADPIEQEGMRRAREVFAAAQIKIFVGDSSDESSLQAAEQMLGSLLPETEIDTATETPSSSSSSSDNSGNNSSAGAEGESPAEYEDSQEDRLLLVMNKIDAKLDAAASFAVGKRTQTRRTGRRFSEPPLEVSCLTGAGLENLERAISAAIESLLSNSSTESTLITRDRHRRHLLQCVRHLEAFLSSGLPMDAAAEELRLATQELGRVTGRVDVEELLDVIFRDFCIGK